VDEVAVIDDGSTDQTANVARLAGATVLRHTGNLGYGAALRTGFDYARSNGTEVLVILDGDGQHRPEFIPSVIDPVAKGDVDVCIASRFLDEEATTRVPAYRRVGISILTGMTNFGSKSISKVHDAQSGFRAYSRAAVDRLFPKETGMGASAEILWDADRAGLRIREVPVKIDYDVEGSSQGPVRHALSVIGSMVRYVETERPIATFSVIGLVLLLIGLFFGLQTVNRYYASVFHPFAVGLALLTILFVLVGTMLIFTGVILHAVVNANRRTR
jgi:glycosyltransferase involved in cell wall biosynthesis